jgi:hypothetical protein
LYKFLRYSLAAPGASKTGIGNEPWKRKGQNEEGHGMWMQPAAALALTLFGTPPVFVIVARYPRLLDKRLTSLEM